MIISSSSITTTTTTTTTTTRPDRHALILVIRDEAVQLHREEAADGQVDECLI